jgi:DNA-directed RNA polymerase specialized sigma24 family protein
MRIRWHRTIAMPNSISPGGDSSFPATRWSRVVAAGGLVAPGARSALEELCAAYWHPIYAFIRRKGNDAEKSLDLTQGYFARLLEHGVLAAADPRKGSFRGFLRTDCEHFLIDRYRRENTLERGGAIRNHEHAGATASQNPSVSMPTQ